MKCFQCDKGKPIRTIAEVPGEVRGEKFTVRCEAMVCDRCGFQVLSDEQSAMYTVAVSDAFREGHGLLTSRELREARERLGLSQRAFARYLRVGVASVKRWEAGLIQDEAHDQLIRLRTNLALARENVRELEQRSSGRPGRPQVIEIGVQRRSPEASEWIGESDLPLALGATIAPAFFRDTCYGA